MKRRRNRQETALGHTATRSSAETKMRLGMSLLNQVRKTRNGDSPIVVRPARSDTTGATVATRGITRSLSRVVVTLLVGIAPIVSHAVKPVEDVLPQKEAELPPSRPISYANATNAELDALGARWGYLSAPERRALLAEVRRRMMQNSGVAGGHGKVRIQATRQFGVVQRPDGTTIRVERRIIRMIPANQGYGTGFEQRTARDDSSLPATPQEAERRALEQQSLQTEKLSDDITVQSPSPAAQGMMPVSSPTGAGTTGTPSDLPQPSR